MFLRDDILSMNYKAGNALLLLIKVWYLLPFGLWTWAERVSIKYFGLQPLTKFQIKL